MANSTEAIVVICDLIAQSRITSRMSCRCAEIRAFCRDGSSIRLVFVCNIVELFMRTLYESYLLIAPGLGLEEVATR